MGKFVVPKTNFYRKIPVISPGLILLRKGFLGGLINGGGYIGGEGRVYRQNKKKKNVSK